jgi:poly-gamma-glutamate synthesis protein (capsule biosynthesis protein)
MGHIWRSLVKNENSLLTALILGVIFAAFLSSAVAVYCIVVSAPAPRLNVVEDITEPAVERYKSVKSQPSAPPIEIPEALKGPVTPSEDKPVLLSLVGDCTLGQNFGSTGERTFAAFYRMNSPEYFFSGVRDIFASDDLTIVNLEGALTDSANMRAKGEDGPKYWLSGPPEYAYILHDGSVEIANLANNHTKDFGDEGYQDTMTALRAAGVAHFGGDDVIVREVRGIKVGFFGLPASSGAEIILERVTALRKSGADVVIASFHGGISSTTYTPTESQIKAARAAIDSGADVVVEHHPHVIQGIEEYGGGVIAYSLGNFCFGGHSNPEDKDTMIFQVSIAKRGGKISISHRVIPASISSHEDYNDYRPRILTDGEAISVRAKILKLSSEAMATAR